MPNRNRRLLAALDRLTPELRRQVAKALDSLRQSATLPKLIEAIERGDELSLRLALGTLTKDFDKAKATLEKAFAVGQRDAAAFVPRVNLQASQALTAPVERQVATLVTGVRRETQQAIRTVVAQAFREGLSPRHTAELIQPLIGLTERQATAVLNLRKALEKQGKKATQIEQAAKKYSDRLLKQRAELIARTEILTAANQGKKDAWMQARQQGLLGPEMRMTWIVTPDDKLCPVCAPLDGEQAVIGGAFSIAGPPAHPQCRCTLGLVERRNAARRAA